MAYEAVCIVLKSLASAELITIPVTMYPLLPTKPTMTFLVFVVLALFIKCRERIYLRSGRTHEEYQSFLKTNVNSLHFALFTVLVFVVAALVDFAVSQFVFPALVSVADLENAEHTAALWMFIYA